MRTTILAHRRLEKAKTSVGKVVPRSGRMVSTLASFVLLQWAAREDHTPRDLHRELARTDHKVGAALPSPIGPDTADRTGHGAARTAGD